MPQPGAQSLQNYYDIEHNGALALNVLNSYYRTHLHTGRFYDEFPDFFLVKPQALAGKVVATRPSEKLLLEDSIMRAQARNGYVGVSKQHNPKLNFYWLELSVSPFMLGDALTADNKGEFYFILAKFIEYTRLHPKIYGDLTEGIETDRDLELMISGIGRIAGCLDDTLKVYPEDRLVSYSQKWPVAQVKKLLQSLKNNDQEWCELFYEHLIYVMGKKSGS